jgi:hypothetical protein
LPSGKCAAAVATYSGLVRASYEWALSGRGEHNNEVD